MLALEPSVNFTGCDLADLEGIFWLFSETVFTKLYNNHP